MSKSIYKTDSLIYEVYNLKNRKDGYDDFGCRKYERTFLPTFKTLTKSIEAKCNVKSQVRRLKSHSIGKQR